MSLIEGLLSEIDLPPKPKSNEHVLVLGEIEIDIKTGIYYQTNHNDVESWNILAKSDLCVFQLLLNKLDKVATRDEILNAGWGDKVVSLSSVCVAIYNIRTLLKTAGVEDQLTLKNFSGVGYGLFTVKTHT